MSKRPISWRPTERTPEGWVNVYYPSADPFGEEVTVVLDVDGEREVEAARARGDVRVTLTKGAFAGVTFRTNMETGSRLYGDGRTERYGQRAPLPSPPRSRPWNRPAWATSMVVDRLRSIAFCPPSTLSAAAIDAARDVLDHKLVEGEELAGGGDELVERLARGVQDALNRFVVERVRYHNPRPIPSRRFMTPPLELHQAERVRRAFAGRVGMVAMGSWRMIGRVARLLVLPPEPIEWDLWFMISNIEHGWATSIHGTDGDLGVNDFDLGLHFGGPWGMPRWLSDAEVDELDELAMVDSAHGRVPWLSARLADYLRDGFGTSGAELADTWLKQEAERERERSKQVSAPNAPAFALPGWADRWRTYVTPPAFAALALAVWWSEVRPDVERVAKARARTHAPALPLPIAGAVLTQGRKLEMNTLHAAGLALTPSADVQATRMFLPYLHTLAAHRLSRWLSLVAWRASVAGAFRDGTSLVATMNHAGAVAITVHGGRSALAELVGGGRSNKDRTAVWNTLGGFVLVGSLEWASEAERGVVSGLVSSVTERKAAPGRAGEVVITLPPIWTPGAIHLVPRGSPNRILAPVLPVPGIPPKHERYASPLAALDSEAVIYLATHAIELVEEGGVRIPWSELADRQRIPTATLQTALDYWTKREPRWAREGERWFLADLPELQGARDLLTESGRMRLGAREGGRRSALSKRLGSLKRR